MKLIYEEKKQLYFRFRQKLDFPLHLHDAVELFFFTGGSSRITCDSEQYLLSRGDIFIAFPNQVHSYENSRDIQGYLLIIPVKPYLSVFSGLLSGNVPATPCLRAGQWEHCGLLPLVEQAYRDFPTVSETVMQGYLLILMGKLLPLLTTKPALNTNSVLRAILLYLNAHYLESITRKDLADALGYSESYISHVFSASLNTTIPDYLNTLRIQDACSLLEQTDLPVTQIGMDLGFGSIRSFNRAFVRISGKTPGDYRLFARANAKSP